MLHAGGSSTTEPPSWEELQLTDEAHHKSQQALLAPLGK